MSEDVIRIEGVGKQYRLGQVGTGTFSHDVSRWLRKISGKEDLYIKVGEANNPATKGNSDLIWALKDISFNVKQGEVLGIVGKNGAGKSTLLKILSRVTTPSLGEIKVKGRIASLLEVGTGFHPELTGRENIFLNGAILGMTKNEIRSKFDEIVDFSGVERYIDTPVKRYSSGMYVRLAFAVAAHLEPEILIVDEVLAVGDAEFQKKCMGRMKAVSGEGRTVIFVSHNMTAVNSLCTECIYLKQGRVVSKGNTFKIVEEYLSTENTSRAYVEWGQGKNPGDDVAILHSVKLIDKNYNAVSFTSVEKEVGVEFIFEMLKAGFTPHPNIHVFTSKREHAFVSGNEDVAMYSTPGVYKAIMWIPANLLNEGAYVIGTALSTFVPTTKVHFFEQEALIFEVIEDTSKRAISDFNQKIPGVVRPKLQWETKKIN
jgi:lipopolysaccharide transport system ATP-binding protein